MITGTSIAVASAGGIVVVVPRINQGLCVKEVQAMAGGHGFCSIKNSSPLFHHGEILLRIVRCDKTGAWTGKTYWKIPRILAFTSRFFKVFDMVQS